MLGSSGLQKGVRGSVCHSFDAIERGSEGLHIRFLRLSLGILQPDGRLESVSSSLENQLITLLLRGMSCGNVSYASSSTSEGDEGVEGVAGGEDEVREDKEENEETRRSAPILERSVGLEFEVDATGVLMGAMNIDDLERGGLEEVILNEFG